VVVVFLSYPCLLEFDRAYADGAGSKSPEGSASKQFRELRVKYLELFGQPSRSNHKQFCFAVWPGVFRLSPMGICRIRHGNGLSPWRMMPI
jgi:hypothetical protein